MQRSIVSSRVALLLRSAEINLLLSDCDLGEFFDFVPGPGGGIEKGNM